MKKIHVFIFFIVVFCITELYSYTQPPPYWGESLYPIVNWSDIVFIDSQNNEMYCSKNEGKIILPESGIVKMKFKLKNYDKSMTWSGVIKMRVSQIRKGISSGKKYIYNKNITFKPNEIKEFIIDINCSELIEFSKYDSTAHITILGTDEQEGLWQIATPPDHERIKWHLPKDFWPTPIDVYFGQNHFDRVQKKIKNRKNPRNINLNEKQNNNKEKFPYYHQTATITDSRSYYIKPIFNDSGIQKRICFEIHQTYFAIITNVTFYSFLCNSLFLRNYFVF